MGWEMSGSIASRISREYSIACAKCDASDHERDSRTLRESESYWRSMGWKKTKAHGWVCPRCAKETP